MMMMLMMMMMMHDEDDDDDDDYDDDDDDDKDDDDGDDDDDDDVDYRVHRRCMHSFVLRCAHMLAACMRALQLFSWARYMHSQYLGSRQSLYALKKSVRKFPLRSLHSPCSYVSTPLTW